MTMFTRNIRTIVQLGKSGVRWEGGDQEVSKRSNLTLQSFNNKNEAERNTILAGATPGERTELLKKIQSLSGGTKANKEWRVAMIKQISTLNQNDGLVHVDIPQSPTIVAVVAGIPESDVASPQGLKVTAAQSAENKALEGREVHNKAEVKETTTKHLDGTKGSMKYVDSLYEGKSYNRIDINDAMMMVSGINSKLKDGAVDPDTKKLFALISNPQFQSGIDSNQSADTNKWTSDEGKRIKDGLAKFGYHAGADEYADRELTDLRSFIETHLGKDVLSTGKVDPKAKELVDKYFGTFEIKGSIETKPLDSKDLDSLLMIIADMGGIDQGQKPDGVLRGMNSKKYGGWIARLFTGGEWAQNQIISELQAYKMLKDRVTSIDQLKIIIVDNLKTPENAQTITGDIDKIFTGNDTNALRQLLSQYSAVAMNKVAQVRDVRAAASTMSEHNDMVVDQAAKMRERMEKIKEGAKKDPSLLTAIKNKVAEITGENPDVPEKDVQSLLSSWKTTFLSNPSLFIGPSINITNETMIHRIVDQAGKTLSETKATRRTTDVGAFLALGTTLIGGEGRISENVGAGANVGLTGIAGVDGVALQLGASAKASVTMKDNNQTLEPLKGNWVIVGTAGVGKELLKNGKMYPSVGLDVNWNSRIDALKKENFVFKSVLEKLFDDKFQIKNTGITDARNALNELKKRPNDGKENFTIRLLEINLAHLESALGHEKVKSDPKMKDIVVRQWLSAVTSEYDTNAHKNASGIELAGVHVGYMFIANILTLGLNFENIEGGYDRTSESQRQSDTKRQSEYTDTATQEIFAREKAELVSSGVVTVDTTKNTITVNKSYLDVAIDPKSAGITQEKDPTGKIVITGAPGKKMDFVLSEHMDNRGNIHKTLTAYTVQDARPAVNAKEESQEMAAMKLENADITMINSLGLSLARNAPRAIYTETRDGKMADLIQAIAGYGKSEIYDKTQLIAALDKHAKTLGLDMLTVASLDGQQLHQLATVLLKYSYGAKGIMSGGRSGDKLTFSDPMKKEAERIFTAERAVLKTNGAPAGLDSALAESEKQINDKNLPRTDFAKLFEGKKYAGSSMMVVGTPSHYEKNKTGNLSVLAPNTKGYIYGAVSDVRDVGTKEWMLAQSAATTERQRAGLNMFIQKLNPALSGVEMTKDEYSILILTGGVPASFQSKLDTIKQANGLQKLQLNITEAARFIVARVGFPGNECFNASMVVLYPGLSLTIQVAGMPAQEASAPMSSLTGEVGESFTKADTATLGFGLATKTTETTTITQGPESGETGENTTQESGETGENTTQESGATSQPENTQPQEDSSSLSGVDE